MKKTIKLVDVKTDNMTDYKKTSLLLVFPMCSGKCGEKCQNYHMIGKTKTKNFKIKSIIELYNNLKQHQAIVCAGLEPFDTFDDLYNIFEAFLSNIKPVDFVIYTGYTYDELHKTKQIDDLLKCFYKHLNISKNLIIKFGRYNEDQSCNSYISKILGVKLATGNQHVIKFSKSTYADLIYSETDLP